MQNMKYLNVLILFLVLFMMTACSGRSSLYNDEVGMYKDAVNSGDTVDDHSSSSTVESSVSPINGMITIGKYIYFYNTEPYQIVRVDSYSLDMTSVVLSSKIKSLSKYNDKLLVFTQQPSLLVLYSTELIKENEVSLRDSLNSVIYSGNWIVGFFDTTVGGVGNISFGEVEVINFVKGINYSFSVGKKIIKIEIINNSLYILTEDFLFVVDLETGSRSSLIMSASNSVKNFLIENNESWGVAYYDNAKFVYKFKITEETTSQIFTSPQGQIVYLNSCNNNPGVLWQNNNITYFGYITGNTLNAKIQINDNIVYFKQMSFGILFVDNTKKNIYLSVDGVTVTKFSFEAVPTDIYVYNNYLIGVMSQNNLVNTQYNSSNLFEIINVDNSFTFLMATDFLPDNISVNGSYVLASSFNEKIGLVVSFNKYLSAFYQTDEKILTQGFLDVTNKFYLALDYKYGEIITGEIQESDNDIIIKNKVSKGLLLNGHIKKD